MNAYRNAAAPYMEAAEDVAAVSAAPAGTAPSVERPFTDAAATLPAVRHDDIDRTRQQGSLKALEANLMRAAEDSDRLAEQGDLDGLADGYAQLKDFYRAVGDLVRHVEDNVAATMTQDVVNLGDEFTLERHRGRTRRQWDWDGILKALGWDRWIDPESGEYVADTLKQVVSLTASVSPRVTALRDRGVQVDEFCESSPARTTVAIRARSGQ